MSIIYIIGFLFLIYTVFSIWNLITLSRIRRRPLHQNASISDEKYFELKYKQEFIIAVGTIIVGLAAFIGLNTKKDIEDKLTASITANIKDSLNRVYGRINDANGKISDVNGHVVDVTGRLSGIDSRVGTLQTSIGTNETLLKNLSTKSKLELENFQRKLDALNSSNILKEGMYFVECPVDLTKINYIDTVPQRPLTFYFKNLRTLTGNSLPKFETKPNIAILQNSGWTLFADKITTESFRIGVVPLLNAGSGVEGEDSVKVLKVNLLISRL